MPKPAVDDTLFVTGWGKRDYAGSLTGSLLIGRVTLTGNSECRNSNQDIHLCCKSSLQDACEGDSGGKKIIIFLYAQKLGINEVVDFITKTNNYWSKVKNNVLE